MKKKISINNKSGFRGVCWHQKGQKWRAQVSVKNKKIYLGLFSCKLEAAKAYNQSALKYHGEFANPNQIPTE